MKQQQSVRFQNYTPLTKTSSCEARGMNPLILCRWYSFQVPLGEQKGNSWAPCPWLTSLGTAAELCQWPQHAQKASPPSKKQSGDTRLPASPHSPSSCESAQLPCNLHAARTRHGRGTVALSTFLPAFPQKNLMQARPVTCQYSSRTPSMLRRSSPRFQSRCR